MQYHFKEDGQTVKAIDPQCSCSTDIYVYNQVQSAFRESIQDRFNRRCTNVDVNGRYSEMKEAILEAAEEHLKVVGKYRRGGFQMPH